MSVHSSRRLLGWVLVTILPASMLGQAPGAILHAEGGVWVNGYEARDSTAIFPGDLLETKPGFAATLTLDGSSVQIQAESVAKFQGELLVLDHGSVAVGTSRAFRVRVNCMTVVPVLKEWTEYEVTDVNGNVQVAARKDDVNVEREGVRGKPSAEKETKGGGTVHEGQQASYDESEVCGAPLRPTSAGSGLNTKWIEIGAGAAGAGILICVLLCGGGKKQPLSSSAP